MSRIEDRDGYDPSNDPRVDEAVERDQEWRWLLRRAAEKENAMKDSTLIHKAAALAGKDVPDLDLCADTAMPDGITAEASAKLFEREAVLVVDGLVASLPGGTIDRVLAELLRRKASGYVIIDERMLRR